MLASFAYDNLGRRTSLTYGNGAATTYAYDPVSRLASLTQNLAGTTHDLTIGPIAYNPASQILSQTRSNDAYAWTGHGNGFTNSVANGLNQLTSIGGSATTHDARGNLTYDPTTGTTFTYWSDNRLRVAYGGVPWSSFGYDALGRLEGMEVPPAVTRFAYDGLEMIAEYDGANTLQRRHVHGPGVDEPLVTYEGSGLTNRRFLHADERGSIVALSDSSGAMVAINTYDEFGKPGAGNVGRFQYTGQAWLPEVKLHYYKARMYDGRGRFLQPDPIGYGPSPNLYAYVGNDPINFVDPLGLKWVRASVCVNNACTPGEWHWVDEPHLPGFGLGTGPSPSRPPEGGGGGGGGGWGQEPKPGSTETRCIPSVKKVADSLEDTGGKIQDFGAGATAVGLTGSLIALAFPPAEIGTGSLTAAGAIITAFGTGVSAVGAGLDYVATGDLGRAALNGVGFVAGRLKATGNAHDFVRGLNLGKAVDIAKSLGSSQCK